MLSIVHGGRIFRKGKYWNMHPLFIILIDTFGKANLDLKSDTHGPFFSSRDSIKENANCSGIVLNFLCVYILNHDGLEIKPIEL